MFLTWHARRFLGEKMSTTSCKSNAQVLYKQRVLTILTLLLHSTNHRRECVMLRFVEVCWGVHPWELASSFPTPYRLTWLIWSRCTVPNQKVFIREDYTSNFVTFCYNMFCAVWMHDGTSKLTAFTSDLQCWDQLWLTIFKGSVSS